MKLFWKILSGIIPACFIYSSLFSMQLIVDCSGLAYTNIAKRIYKTGFEGIQSVIVDNPFKRYGKDILDSNDPVYDYTDTGTIFQRGRMVPISGGKTDLDDLILDLSSSNITVFCRIDPFIQAEGFNRKVWNNSDFIADANDPTQLYADIRKPAVETKIQAVMQAVMQVNGVKWIIDIRKYPSNLVPAYRSLIKHTLGDLVWILDDNISVDKPKITSAYYWSLRRNIFIAPDASLKKLTGWNFDNNLWQIAESDSFTVNNIAAISYLLIQKAKLILPLSILTPYNHDLFNFCYGFNGKMQVLSDTRLVFKGNGSVIAFNLGDDFSVWKTSVLTDKKGDWKSIRGSAILQTESDFSEVFLLPFSIAFWNTKD